MKKTRPTARVGRFSQGSAPWTSKKRSTLTRTTYPANWEELKRKVKVRDRFKCCKCHDGLDQVQEKGIYLEVDHIIRLADGGTNSMANLQTLCTTCHNNRANHRHLRIRK